MASYIDELKTLRESEDHIEFKRAIHNFPFDGGDRKTPKERRKCLLGYVVALANEHGGRLALGMEDERPHNVSGTDFGVGRLGEIEDSVYERLQIRIRTEEHFEGDKRVLVVTVPSRPIGKTLKFEGIPLMRTGESLRDMSDDEIFRILSEREPDFSAKVCDGLTMEDLDEKAAAIMKEKYAAKQKNPGCFHVKERNEVSATFRLLTLCACSDVHKVHNSDRFVLNQY